MTAFGRWASGPRPALEALAESRGLLELDSRHVGDVPAGGDRLGRRGPGVVFKKWFHNALLLNVHFHSLILEGVYTRPTPRARPVFHRLPPPTDADITALLT